MIETGDYLCAKCGREKGVETIPGSGISWCKVCGNRTARREVIPPAAAAPSATPTPNLTPDGKSASRPVEPPLAGEPRRGPQRAPAEQRPLPPSPLPPRRPPRFS